ncbi:MAG TPA: glycosyltransferase family 1 protein [Methanoregulaceae archaeon]|jgi:glycosyltransferase involved in cell wall biosynthesis|nr:glycosyltransferase family 4 protein [Prolixibacteraceae bacterium]HPS22489.1 glycosyltransferase family 1 protein [Methanoregulaceae archaeon]
MDKIIFIKPIGKGSPSIYSHELAKRLEKYSEIEIKQISTPLLSYHELFNFLKYLIKNYNTIIHFPFYYYAKFALFTRKSIISVHDMWWVDYPYRDIYPNKRDKIFAKMDVKGIKRAIHIITPSVFSKNQLIDYLDINPQKITVIYNGVDHSIFKPIIGQNPFNFDYILFVGSEQPRKNLKTLLEAFKILKQNPDFQNLKLVKVGGPETENFRRQTLQDINNKNLNGEVIFTGYIKEEDLPSIYSNARCFISPSFCEGFGLPTVEAMACGCPVITSNTSAFPEIISDAGLMRNPLDARGFADDIEMMLNDESFRNFFIQKGIKRAKEFSWDIASKEMKKVYDSNLGKNEYSRSIKG